MRPCITVYFLLFFLFRLALPCQNHWISLAAMATLLRPSHREVVLQTGTEACRN